MYSVAHTKKIVYIYGERGCLSSGQPRWFAVILYQDKFYWLIFLPLIFDGWKPPNSIYYFDYFILACCEKGDTVFYPWAMQKYLNIFQWIFLAFSLFGIILFNYTWLKFWGNYANVACECVSRVIEFVLKRSSHLLHKGIALPFTTRETPYNYSTISYNLYVLGVLYEKSAQTSFTERNTST